MFERRVGAIRARVAAAECRLAVLLTPEQRAALAALRAPRRHRAPASATDHAGPGMPSETPACAPPPPVTHPGAMMSPDTPTTHSRADGGAAGTGAATDARAYRIALPLVLPDEPAQEDDCVRRLVRRLERRDGVLAVAVERPASELPALCLDYDPERLSLARVRELVCAAGARLTERFGHATLAFRSVATEDTGRRIEAALRALPGVTGVAVNFAAQVARVEFDREVTSLVAIRAALADARCEVASTVRHVERQVAHAVAPAVAARSATRTVRHGGEHEGEDEAEDEHGHEHAERTGGWYARHRELAWSLAAGAFLAAGWLASRSTAMPGAVAVACYVASYAFGARDNVGDLLADVRRGRFAFNIDLLMLAAAAGAAVLGAWAEGALLLFLFSLGHALEHLALGRARNAITALGELAPQTALVREGGAEREVPIAEVRPGALVVVKPAERLPVDGTVREGRSAVNQAPITGESVPVDKAPGDAVFAGSVNGEGALVIEVTAAVGDRTLDRVIRLVAEAQTQKAPTQQFADRFERVFVPAVLAADVLLIVVPPLLGWWTWPQAFYRGMALLVAASPCALALGTPAAVLAGIAQAARGGVLVKGGAHLEALGQITVLAVDKTGTITKGEPEVTDVVPAAGVRDDDLLATAAAVERSSQHPLARAVVRAAEARALPIPAAGEVQSVTGKGVRAPVDGAMVEIGRLLMFEGERTGGPEGDGDGAVPQAIRDAVARLQAAGRTTVVVRRRPLDHQPGGGGDDARGFLGVLGVADQPREGVRETLTRLRAAGVRRIVMLTGDNRGVGEAVARAVGIDEVRADLLPEDKVAAIRELAAEGNVAMVGDGVNDAPALAHATVGIAMGGAGTAAALETADVALMGDDLGRLPFAVGLSRRARAVIRQNLYISLGVLALLVVSSVFGLVGIGAGVFVHEGSTLLVIANGLRLLAYRGES